MKKCFYVDVDGDKVKIGVLTEKGESLRGCSESLASWVNATPEDIECLKDLLGNPEPAEGE